MGRPVVRRVRSSESWLQTLTECDIPAISDAWAAEAFALLDMMRRTHPRGWTMRELTLWAVSTRTRCAADPRQLLAWCEVRDLVVYDRRAAVWRVSHHGVARDVC